MIAPKGPVHVRRLALAIADPETRLPATVRELGGLLLEQIAELDRKIAERNKELYAAVRQDEEAVRAMTVPGVGPISALAIQALAPPLASFRRGRDFSAWLGLVPRQHSTAGKPRLGKISKMGQRDLRRLLVVGAMSVIRNAVRHGVVHDPWLARMLARNPKKRKLVAVALANRMARILWALAVKKETYRAPAAAGGAASRRRMQAGQGRGKGKRSMRRDRENQAEPACLRALGPDMDPVRVSPYRPAALTMPHREAGHTTAPDRMTQTQPKKLLASREASTHESGSGATNGILSCTVPALAGAYIYVRAELAACRFCDAEVGI